MNFIDVHIAAASLSNVSWLIFSAGTMCPFTLPSFLAFLVGLC